LRIVGVAANSKYFTLGEEGALAFYRPSGQEMGANSELNFVVRAEGGPNAVIPAIRRTLDELDGTAALEVRPMRNALALAMLPSRAGAAMLGATGLLGLALAAIGLYGTLLYGVSRRTREIGLRMALGASPGGILRMVMRESLLLAGAGIAIGTAIATVAVRPLAAFLTPEVHPADPGNFLAVASILLLVALLATAAPAARALRVDPTVALRYE
jgi:ABC-type antimicrobial peptide transport system permease subunit